MRTANTAFVACALFTMTACSEAEPAAPEMPPPDTLAASLVFETNHSGITTSARTVIRSDAEWADFWKTLVAAGQVSDVPRPDVAFGSTTVLLAVLGLRQRAGHDIEFSRLAVRHDTIVATVLLTRPGTGCSEAEVISTPLTIVSVDRVGLAVEFEDEIRVEDC